MDINEVSSPTLVRIIEPRPRVIDQLNRVLRGELSAVEAYERVMEQFSTDPEIHRLNVFKEDHQDSVRILRAMISHEGALPSDDSGVWGAIVKTVIAAGRLFGSATALTALRQGEEFGLSLYMGLEREDLKVDDLRIVQEKLIPRQQDHIERLKEMAHYFH